MGPLNRFLTKTFHLRPHDLANLSFLYFATFVMRAAAFAGVAVMQHAMSSLDSFWKGVLFAVYPLAEITTVGYFGALCDRLGRKRILVLAHFVTAVAVVLFIPSISPPTPVGIRPYLVALFFAMFGIGAAAKVASTLAMVNDHANVENRAQLMAFFDLVTFGGLVAGFGSGFLALKASVPEALVLGAAGIGVAVSTVLVLALVRETPPSPTVHGVGPRLLRRPGHPAGHGDRTRRHRPTRIPVAPDRRPRRGGRDLPSRGPRLSRRYRRTGRVRDDVRDLLDHLRDGPDHRTHPRGRPHGRRGLPCLRRPRPQFHRDFRHGGPVHPGTRRGTSGLDVGRVGTPRKRLTPQVRAST